MIPMVDLKIQYHALKNEIDSGILAALESTQFILGPNVGNFEKEAAAYLGAKHAISCASGTDALHLALAAAGVGPGDEVITSPFTFIATAEAIRYVGAIPVFVDIDPQSFNIDPKLIEAAITPRTKAILPVHIFGQPADLTAIDDICKKRGLILIEDCAQSFGASINGRMTGAWGAFGCFSFFPSKNLGCYGDGGLITTNDDALVDTIKMYRNHGSRVRYYHDVIGFNSRLDEIQAVVLRIKLKHIDEFNKGRRRVAHLYSSLLKGSILTPPAEDGIGVHVYHQYTTLTNKRDAVMEALSREQISSAVYYPVPLHKQNVFAADYKDVRLPVTEDVSQRCLSLPVFPEMTDEQVRRVVEVVGNAR